MVFALAGLAIAGLVAAAAAVRYGSALASAKREAVLIEAAAAANLNRESRAAILAAVARLKSL